MSGYERELAEMEVKVAEAHARLPNPPCKNHPDRDGSAFYPDPENKKKYGFALCQDCLSERLGIIAREPLDEHGVRMATMDTVAVEQRINGGV